jgi:hypothetical protein
MPKSPQKPALRVVEFPDTAQKRLNEYERLTDMIAASRDVLRIAEKMRDELLTELVRAGQSHDRS